ncbi:MAG: STM3941 family protein [Hyphomicrobiales bacterium]
MSGSDRRDDKRPVEVFEGSPWRSLLLAAGSAGMSALCAATALGVFRLPENFSIEIAAFGAVFFAVCAVLWAARGMQTGPVVSIGPEGIRDSRLSDDWIPWPEISGIGVISLYGVRIFRLDVNPEFQRGLRQSALSRMWQWANEMFGYRGLFINPQGLKGSFHELEAALERGHARAKDKPAARAS